MHAPVGYSNWNERTIPIKKQNTDNIADEIITPLKVLNTLIEVNAGNIIRLDISIAPIILIPNTIIKDVSIDISVL